MVARIPPKQFMLDAFIEERRSKLQRWLILISQHPIFARCEMLKIFLTENSDRHQEMINAIEIDGAEKLSTKYELKLIVEKQNVAMKINNEIQKIKRFMNQQVKRELDIAEDFYSLSISLSNVIQESGDNSLNDFSENFIAIHNEYDKPSRENQHASVIERIELIIEVFTSFCDLTERVDESLKIEKMPSASSGSNRWQKLQSAIKGNNYENNENAEEREQRINFAVHCVLEEFKFSLKYLKILPSILLKFTHEQSNIYSNIAKVLNAIVEAECDKLDS